MRGGVKWARMSWEGALSLCLFCCCMCCMLCMRYIIVYEIIANLIKSAYNIRYANLFVVKKSILV